ncbi:MAG: serine--tRNA ligase [bacterium]|nr:serine--tRNA ligase [bacterium]
MLDINLIRNEPEKVKKGLKAKNADPALVDKFLELDEKWRSVNTKFDELRHKQRELGEAKDILGAKALKEDIKKVEAELMDLDKFRTEILHQMPNLPLDSALVGKDETHNKVLREEGAKPKLKDPKDYLSLAQGLGLIDTERAVKISGSRFGYIKGAAAMLEFALVDLALKTLIKEGFTPIVPPVLVRPEIMVGMGKVKFIEGGDAFYLPADDLYLVGSSEHSIGPMYKDEVLKTLPLRYVGFSTCFRKEAGSYGKDTKGILRVHQFDKVEMFSFSAPEDSEKEHKFLLSLQEKLMQALELPYRVVEICTGDMGWSDGRQYDVETWLPGQPSAGSGQGNNRKGEYRETQSTSNTVDFQSRGLNIKYKKEDGKTAFAHMLNGTAFAIGRMIIAIIENYQTEQGTIRVPKALQNYLGMEEIKASNRE